MKTASFGSRVSLFYKKYKKLFFVIFVAIIVWALLGLVGSFYEPFNPKVLFSKETADAAKQYILGFGSAAPIVFLSLQVLQVLVAPIPGQATGFAGGYVFGWEWGTIYTMTGLTIGSFIVFILSRKLGRGFVEKFNGPEAMKEFEGLFLSSEGKVGEAYQKSKASGVATFFLIMLLPALPDDLVCFIGGLTRIPIWQLMIATFLGRFPGMLVLSLVGDGFSQARSNTALYSFIGVTVALTLIYIWKKQQIEGLMKRSVGVGKSS
jgi:uncharacterized membrane protein YdjX (TVP38/TMEM64 family)